MNIVRCVIASVMVITPLVTQAVNLQVSGWIPDWRKSLGVADVIEHRQILNTVSPFAFRVDANGALVGGDQFSQAPWTDLYVAAKTSDTKVIPSVLWGDRENIHRVLSHRGRRTEHINQIVEQILSKPYFDGVDIDYESKSHETRQYFSFFLNSLHKKTKAMNKTLVCTIEPRTPIEDKVTKVDEALLASIEYSNDYYVIGRSCDVVRIMAYDQGAIDIKLNAEKKSNNFYAPVADVAWVEKVIKLAIKDIPAHKIELGVPTYGYQYELTPRTGGGYTYKRIGAINYPQARSLAVEYGKILERNSAGEVSFFYPTDEFPGSEGYGKTTLVWLSDSTAIAQKIKLAKKYKLRGITVFKFDGEHDGELWKTLARAKK